MGSHKKVKITVVGDSLVGKTCLLMAFVNNQFPEDNICGQSLFENSKGTIRAGSEGSFEVPVTFKTESGIVEFGLTDTIGTKTYRSLREVFGAKTDIFLVCFSVTEPETLENVRTDWLTEIKILTPGAPFILVGTKTDLRENSDVLKKLREAGKEPVSLLQGIKLAKRLGAKEYVECSALNMVGVKQIFTTVAIITEQLQEPVKNQYKPKNGQINCVIS